MLNEKEKNYQICIFYTFLSNHILKKDIQERIESEITEKYQVDLNTFQENCEKGEKDYSYVCKLIR